MTHNHGEIKQKYRLEADMDIEKSDFSRLDDGSVDPDYLDIYIACQYDNRIWHYGRSILTAYIPSLQRGHNILKKLQEKDIPITNLQEGDSEVCFNFHVKYLGKR